MGCDIHILVEIKYPSEDWKLWLKRPYVAYGNESLSNHEIDCLSSRNYVFFSALGNVRSWANNFDAVAPFRGVPENASLEVKQWATQGDYHSMTWATLEEIEQALETVARFELEELALEEEETVDEEYEYAAEVYLKDGSGMAVGYTKSSAGPIRKAYDDLCAEAWLLDHENPDIRFIIGFDS